MTKPRAKGRAGRKGAEKTAGKTAAPVKRTQPHGGALLTGGMPGNRGGTGRPPSELKRRLVGSAWDRVAVLEQIADGEPIVHADIPLHRILPHVTCPKCAGPLEAKDAASLMITSIEGKVSASPGDRRAAVDTMLKHGLSDAIAVADVRAALDLTGELIRDRFPADVAEALIVDMRAIWLKL